MKADELRALAERVAAATGPDREVDTDIFLQIRPSARGRIFDAPRYTSSLDAAMSLVPEGLAFTVGQNVHHRYWVASVNELDADGYPQSTGCSDASRSPALALTCAALLARASLIDSQTKTTHD